MLPQFVKSNNFPRFLIDEKNVKSTNYVKKNIHVVKSNGFRMFLSPTCKYLYAVINRTHQISVKVENNRVVCQLHGVKNAEHSHLDHSSFYNSPLLYLVLFIYDLYRDKFTNLMWYLRGTFPNKPFTTHCVFYDEPFAKVECSNRYQVNECCKMYVPVMEGDSLFPLEICEPKPWDILTLQDLYNYNKQRGEYNTLFKKNCDIVKDSHIEEHISLSHVDEPYILFEKAVEYNRVDMAVALSVTNSLNKSVLRKIVLEYPYNDVVKFVYSLPK